MNLKHALRIWIGGTSLVGFVAGWSLLSHAGTTSAVSTVAATPQIVVQILDTATPAPALASASTSTASATQVAEATAEPTAIPTSTPAPTLTPLPTATSARVSGPPIRTGGS